LIEFRHDLYPGTGVPKNFSSLVHLQNPQTGEGRKVLIHMNHPLRYGGETFYQASFDPTDDQVTILQVVRNPALLTPYAACLTIACGLLIHFGVALSAFVKRRAAVSPLSRPVRHAGTRSVGAAEADSALMVGDDAASAASEPRWIKGIAAKWSSRALLGGISIWLALSLAFRA